MQRQKGMFCLTPNIHSLWVSNTLSKPRRSCSWYLIIVQVEILQESFLVNQRRDSQRIEPEYTLQRYFLLFSICTREISFSEIWNLITLSSTLMVMLSWLTSVSLRKVFSITYQLRASVVQLLILLQKCWSAQAMVSQSIGISWESCSMRCLWVSHLTSVIIKSNCSTTSKKES